MKASFALLVFLVPLLGTVQADEPKLAREHIVLHTMLGDLVLGLYPDVAPRHVAQILRLVRLGVYDGTYFYRIEPSFVAQIAVAQARRQPLTPEQSAAIERIPAEFGAKHLAGTLTMARDAGDPDSAQTSFSILYAAAPHLDGQYTVFGRLEFGESVLEAIAKVARDRENRPLQTIEVVRAEVVDSAEALARALRERPRSAEATRVAGVEGKPATAFLALVGLMMAFGVATFVLVGRASPRIVGSVGLLTTLVGGFLLITALASSAASDPLRALVLFIGIVALFRLMGRFEGE